MASMALDESGSLVGSYTWRRDLPAVDELYLEHYKAGEFKDMLKNLIVP